MGTKTVRMELEDERILARIRRRTGWTASDALKQGLHALERDLLQHKAPSAYDIYMSLDLGPGGYAKGPSTKSREVARQAIRRKHAR